MIVSTRVPDLGKLSLAILEHGVSPILGEKAIQVLRTPADEKELRNALEAALTRTENRFAKEHADLELRQTLLSLPTANLPSLRSALSGFYSRPNDSTFREILKSQLAADYKGLSDERIETAVLAYIRILREELVPLSNEIRDKLSTLALLGMNQNIARIADDVGLIRAALYNPGEVFVSEAPAAPKQKGKEPKRELVYEVSAQSDIETIKGEWKFLSSSITTVAISNGIIDIGSVDGQTSSFPQIDPLSNCSVECELRILETANNDTSLWAGIRLRGFIYDFRFGYLAYIRRMGAVEFYRAMEVIAGANERIVADTKEAWTHIRVDVYKNRMRVWVGGTLHANVTDKKFSDKGLVYLHTYYSHAQFRNLRIFKLR